MIHVPMRNCSVNERGVRGRCRGGGGGVGKGRGMYVVVRGRGARE